MDDKENKKPKPAPPPLPGFLRPNSPQPPKPPQFGGPPLPGFPQNPRPQFQPAAGLNPAGAPAEAGASASSQMKEEKEKLEKKILEMEKLLSQEKERALLATLKSQQDETLSSKVESSLKDIQERMRRDKRDQQVEEERISLKNKIKELEACIVQERETWMQTLKGQLAERESQGRDVEGHFLYRLQEMERRWLDEKAQWQKEISTREDAIRSLKSDSERLRELEDEFRRVSMEKSMAEKEISKLRDDVARADREKASIESYIKVIPEKERELAELRSENAVRRMREEHEHTEAKHREEKYLSEIEKLQRELGSLSDRKNSERDEELKAVQARYDALIQEKEKAIAEISGDKIRAISELVKIKGFVSKVQAINAALEKERGRLRLEKMQLAQNMAAQLEEIRKLRQEWELLKASHSREIEELSEKHRKEMEGIKFALAAEFSSRQEEKIGEITRQRSEKILELTRRHQEEMSAYAAKCRAERDTKLSETRDRMEQSVAEEIGRVKSRLEADYAAKFSQLKELAAASENGKTRFESENRRLIEELKNLEKAAAEKQGELAARLEAQSGLSAAQKAENEKYMRAFEAERSKFGEELSSARKRLEDLAAQKSSVEAELSRLASELKAESARRAASESGMLALNTRVQEMEKALAAGNAALAAERGNLESFKASSQTQLSGAEARISELSAEIEKYRSEKRGGQ